MLVRILSVAIALGAIASLAGCSYNSEEKQRRLDALNSAVAEFDAGSLGDVICEASGGEAAFGKGYNHTYVFEGTAAWQALGERFEALGYDGSNSAPYLFYSRPDGIAAAGSLVDQPDADPDRAHELEALGCEAPDSPYVVLTFDERSIPSSD